MCPLVKEFQKHSDTFETVVCVTGQHREMLDQVLQIFDVKPDYDLNIMKQGQDLYDVTARVLTGMRDVLDTVKPAEDGKGDLVLRIYDSKKAAGRAVLKTSLPVKSAFITNMLEEPISEVPVVDDRLNAVRTLLFKYSDLLFSI